MISRFFRWLLDPEDAAAVRAAKFLTLVAMLFVCGAVVFRAFLGGPNRSDRSAAETAPAEREVKITRSKGSTKAVWVESAPPEILAKAVDHSSLREVIRNLRVAAARGDERTQAVLLEALKRRPDAARAAIDEEIQKATDHETAFALSRIRDEVGR